ncbi:hypothetical protein HAX54_040728 [Datura stramonium]|uniref:Pre-mRNA-splicing factor SYF2 n=1 Tax=Datura stramonium TaxID=4076 RepID=A0ABS8SLJ0_DATST|nr:hypothetical protein [Datura stramonium]
MQIIPPQSLSPAKSSIKPLLPADRRCRHLRLSSVAEIAVLKETENMTEERRVHPDCPNASNPYHECSEYCFRIIAEAKKQMSKAETGVLQANAVDVHHHSVVTSDGDMSKAYMLDTQESAEAKYKKRRRFTPAGWDVFNQKTLYNAYKKRTKNVAVDVDEYNKMKEADPEFYREASSLQYGKAPKLSEDKIERMVKELKDRDEKRQSFSRRRKFHEEKDIDSINDRNEHFNKKIERAFGKYTLEIKNNLERGTALPD